MGPCVHVGAMVTDSANATHSAHADNNIMSYVRRSIYVRTYVRAYIIQTHLSLCDVDSWQVHHERLRSVWVGQTTYVRI